MSGGVDSSVTAALIAEAGYDTVGITLQLYDHGQAVRRRGACCAGVDIHDARHVATQIGIPHYVLNYESRFRTSVIDDFADSYLRGETPIPCVRCNQTVKFSDLLGTARDLGAAALCTGHYVRRLIGPDGPELHAAVDPAKDQSYFLHATTPSQLAFLRFPLGGLSKDETRAHARRFGLEVADKPDSQDICFVPDGNYGDVVRRLRPGAIEPGDILHVDGTLLGRHDGIIDYTIGQRRGLGIGGRRETAGTAGSAPLYVVGIDAENRRVTVGPRASLLRNRVSLKNVNWLARELVPEAVPVVVKLRSSQTAVAARLRLGSERTAELLLDTGQHGIANGQAAVFYDRATGSRVLGGGTISAADFSTKITAGGQPTMRGTDESRGSISNFG